MKLVIKLSFLLSLCLLSTFSCQGGSQHNSITPTPSSSYPADSSGEYGGTEIGNPGLNIYASQVIFDNSGTTLGSSNAQEVLQELGLNLAEVMVGKWTITNRNQEEEHVATGEVTINSDGTFNLSMGSFAAIGMGTDGSLCDHIEAGQVYEVIANGVVMFTHMNGTTQNTVIPTLASLRKDKIVFVGSGGCGEVGRQRVSILEREK